MDPNTNGRSTITTPDNQKVPPAQECDVCHEEHSRSCVAPCGDIYCAVCLNKHIKHSLEQEATFPVSCCGQDIPFDDMTKLMAPHIRQKYIAATEQFDVPTNERVFCSGGCGLFLGSSTGAATLSCSKCKQSTCTQCKEKEHGGDCRAGDAALETLMQAQRWQKCTNCKSIVELHDGCNHITCRCGHQFCYICSAEWQTCNCQLYGPNDLQHVLGEQNGDGPPPAQEARCYRHDWYAVHGRRRCETCGHRRDQWRCRTCTIVSCRECRFPGERFGLWG